MKFAVVDGQRHEPQPRLRGTCPACGDPMVARCGDVRIWHWTHLGRRYCDPWWEETLWHREWKANFPVEWQEVVQRASDGEVHIADVKTDQGWVLEFQHSPLDSQERQAREDFYKKMVWVVDGTRRSRDKPQLLRAVADARPINPTLWRLSGFWDECAILREWQGRKVLVVFDFGESDLWALLPTERSAYIAVLPRDEFIEFYRNASGDFEHVYTSVVPALTEDLAKLRAQDLLDQQRAQARTAAAFQRLGAWQRPRRRL